MKIPAFAFERANSLADAFAAFAASDEAVFLAGGHSVVPSLALRLQAPEKLIDISQIDELRGISVVNGTLRIGALTRHSEVASDALIRTHAPLLALAAPFVAHPAIRNRGTIGGNLVHADPASEFPAVMLALEAEMEITCPGGTRFVAAHEFFKDIYETACKAGEILVAIHVPVVAQNTRCVFDEFVRRHGDYAMVGCGIQITFDGAIVRDPRISFLSVGSTPLRASGVEGVLEGSTLSSGLIARAQDVLENDLEPLEDPNVPVEMRLHLARVLMRRLLERMEAGNV